MRTVPATQQPSGCQGQLLLNAHIRCRWRGRETQIGQLLRMIGRPAQAGTDVFVWGAPQTGRTSIVRQVFFADLSFSVLDPVWDPTSHAMHPAFIVLKCTGPSVLLAVSHRSAAHQILCACAQGVPGCSGAPACVRGSGRDHQTSPAVQHHPVPAPGVQPSQPVLLLSNTQANASSRTSCCMHMQGLKRKRADNYAGVAIDHASEFVVELASGCCPGVNSTP